MDRNAEIAEKTVRLTKLMAAEDLGGIVIGAQHNFSWLTAGGSNGIDTSREPGAGALLIRNDGKKFVLANRIEMPRLLVEELKGEDFEPVEFGWEDEKANTDLVAERAQALIENGSILGSDLPIGGQARVCEEILARCRFRLTEAEIERFRQLGADAGQAIGDFARALTPGETEREVAGRAAAALYSHGIHPVVVLVAGDDRIQRFRHPVPTERRWENLLMVVVCGRRGGLIVSLTRIIAVGPVDGELRRRTDSVARVNAHLLAATRQGATGAELYDTAAKAYATEGFDGEQHRHHQGGACGYRTRDWVAHPASSEQVQLNQAFAWNPSITGTKAEETVITSDDGIEVITRSPDWPLINVAVDGREYLSPDVLSI